MTKIRMAEEERKVFLVPLCKYDSNKKAIYEGDILEDTISYRPKIGYVFYSVYSCQFRIRALDKMSNAFYNSLLETKNYTIIGNVFDNPELLNNRKKNFVLKKHFIYQE